MPWYEGSSLLYHLEHVHIASDRNLIDCRFPVQWVIRPMTDEHHDYRGYAGQIASGVFRRGDEVVVLPSGHTTRIREIDSQEGPVEEAFPPLSVTMLLEDEIDISRGDFICRPHNQPTPTREFEAMVCWMNDTPLNVRGRYALKHTARTVRAIVDELRYRVDVNTLHRDETADTLLLNEIGRVKLRTSSPLLVDEYRRNHTTGSFVLIDEATNATVAGGMILEIDDPGEEDDRHSPDVTWHAAEITREDRWESLGAGGATLWFTGLPASGKSTLAVALERRLVQSGRPAYLLDGDNLRHGINGDLAFSEEDRAENIRRTAHVARMLADAGVVALVSLVSPLAAERDRARALHAADGLPFKEIWVNTPLEVCERRDPKGLYARARRGELTNLTGIGSPYEPPADPDLVVSADRELDVWVDELIALLGG
jgi:bifunctional enzyme CysN/CysC